MKTRIKDEQIIELIKIHNGHVDSTFIGREFGITRQVAAKRIQSMEKKGIILPRNGKRKFIELNEIKNKK